MMLPYVAVDCPLDDATVAVDCLLDDAAVAVDCLLDDRCCGGLSAG